MTTSDVAENVDDVDLDHSNASHTNTTTSQTLSASSISSPKSVHPSSASNNDDNDSTLEAEAPHTTSSSQIPSSINTSPDDFSLSFPQLDGTSASIVEIDAEAEAEVEADAEPDLDSDSEIELQETYELNQQEGGEVVATVAPSTNLDRKRVKVYELRENNWFDKGTGFCTVTHVQVEDDSVHATEPRIFVESEEKPQELLLDAVISSEQRFTKQDNLIVWNECTSGLDTALSFQEAEGCIMIWKIIELLSSMVRQLTMLQKSGAGETTTAADDDASDSLIIEGFQRSRLPEPEYGNLQEIDAAVEEACCTTQGRIALIKTLLEGQYLPKLAHLVEISEEMHNLTELHRLCRIMKNVIALNDSTVIERILMDDCFIWCLAALEYDPEFPRFKANHRQWLQSDERFKVLIPIENPTIRTLIHATYRLQYLRDVALARCLDDPTFSVFNSLIFYNQIEILRHFQGNKEFIQRLFSIIHNDDVDHLRKREAVLFIQQYCTMAKSFQPSMTRLDLIMTLVSNGLLKAIYYGLCYHEATIRVAAVDILVTLVDCDPYHLRFSMYKTIYKDKPPLIDLLIHTLLYDSNSGLRSQISEVLRVILDVYQAIPPNVINALMAQDLGPNHLRNIPNKRYQARARVAALMQGIDNGESILEDDDETDASNEVRGRSGSEYQMNRDETNEGEVERAGQFLAHQHELVLEQFFARSINELFQPLICLQGLTGPHHFTSQQTSVFPYLVEMLCFFNRQHPQRVRSFIVNQDMFSCVGQLFHATEKHLSVLALRFFKHILLLNDSPFIQLMVEQHIVSDILALFIRTLPRDNLVGSSCLDFFEIVRKDDVREIWKHLVEDHRAELETLSKYSGAFREFIEQYDFFQLDASVDGEVEMSGDPTAEEGLTGEESTDATAQNFLSQGTTRRRRRRVQGSSIRPRLPSEGDEQEDAGLEEDYWTPSDDEDDVDDETLAANQQRMEQEQKAAIAQSPLVDYTSDSDSDGNETTPDATSLSPPAVSMEPTGTSSGSPTGSSASDRSAEKRRREAMEEGDEEGSATVPSKRRASIHLVQQGNILRSTSPYMTPAVSPSSNTVAGQEVRPDMPEESTSEDSQEPSPVMDDDNLLEDGGPDSSSLSENGEASKSGRAQKQKCGASAVSMNTPNHTMMSSSVNVGGEGHDE